MKKIIAVTLAALLLSSCASVGPEKISSDFKVETSIGHGSGVHIGKGYTITAAHVVVNQKQATLKNQKGKKYKAEVLWANDKYDVALLKTDKGENLQTHKIDCREPIVGEIVYTIGNPGHKEFITTYGKVVSPIVKDVRGMTVFYSDVDMFLGSSGGPVYDSDGEIIGIVHAMDAALDMYGRTIKNGFAYIIPSTVMCRLLNLT